MNHKLVPTLLTEPMSEVLRNEHCVYQTEQELYNALLEAAPDVPVGLEPVAYMAPSGTCVTAEDVSYTPSWANYYTIPLYAAPPAKVEQQSQEPVAWMGRDGEDFSYKESSYFTKPLFLAPQPAIPEGYMLAPKEPTEAMILAARHSHEGEVYLPYSVYKSMIEAAQGGKP